MLKMWEQMRYSSSENSLQLSNSGCLRATLDRQTPTSVDGPGDLKPSIARRTRSASERVASSQSEPMPRHLASVIARFTSAANLWPNAVDRARRRNADFTHQGCATIAVALHSSKMIVDKGAGDAIKIALVLGGESGPVARERAASAAAPTERGHFR